MIAQLFDRNATFGIATALMAGLSLLSLTAMAFDSRSISGVNVWLKPVKFELSLLVYFATLVWCSQWIPAALQEQRLFQFYNAIIVCLAVIEMIWIIGAAASGQASHFNTEQPLLAAVYPLMGIVAIALLSATLTYGVLIVATTTDVVGERFWRHAIGASLIATFALTAFTAGYLASSGGHGVGAAAQTEVSSGLLGWLREAGDLRVAHFFAMHTMQLVPLAIWVIVLLTPVSQSLALVYSVLLLYTALVAMTFFQALAGKPFLPSVL